MTQTKQAETPTIKVVCYTHHLGKVEEFSIPEGQLAEIDLLKREIELFRFTNGNFLIQFRSSFNNNKDVKYDILLSKDTLKQFVTLLNDFLDNPSKHELPEPIPVGIEGSNKNHVIFFNELEQNLMFTVMQKDKQLKELARQVEKSDQPTEKTDE